MLSDLKYHRLEGMSLSYVVTPPKEIKNSDNYNCKTSPVARQVKVSENLKYRKNPAFKTNEK